MGVYCGAYISLGLAVTLKSFLNSFGCSQISYFEKNLTNVDFRNSFLLNKKMRNFSEINTLIMIGFNPRLELPLLNSTLRKNFLNNSQFRAYSFGLGIEYLTYPIINLGSSVKSLYKFLLGLNLISNFLFNNDSYSLAYFNNLNQIFPHFFFGSSNNLRYDRNNLINSLFMYLTELNVPLTNLNIINRHFGRISLSEVGFGLGIKSKSALSKFQSSFNFIIGVDQFQLIKENPKNFNVFQGSFYVSNFLEKVNLILPVSIYTETTMQFLNLEGRFRSTNKAISPFKFVFNDTAVINSLSVLSRSFYKANFSIFSDFYLTVKLMKGCFNFYLNYLANLKSLILGYIVNVYTDLSVVSKHLPFSNYLLNNSLLSKIVYNYYSSEIFSKKSKVLTIMSYKIKFINFDDKIRTT